MPASPLDLVQMTVTGTPGTGTITLNAAVSGYLTASQAGAIDGRIYSYTARDTSVFEYGRGVYTASGTTLTRGPINGSSGAGTAVTLTSAAKITLVLLAEDLIPLNRPHNWNGVAPLP